MSSHDDTVQLRPLLSSISDVSCDDNDAEEGVASRHLSMRETLVRELSLKTARKVISTHPEGVIGGGITAWTADSSNEVDLVEERANVANGAGIFLFRPWNRLYRLWWHLTALGAVLTVFHAPYIVAFSEFHRGALSCSPICYLERANTLLFTLDILINFNLVRYDDEDIIYDRCQIASDYVFRGMFWMDFVGVFSFHWAALSALHWWKGLDEALIDTTTMLLLSLLRLSSLVRLHRWKKMFDELRYNANLSQLAFTLFRDLFFVVINCHLQACSMYFLAHLHGFGDDTWLGLVVSDRETTFGRYITSLYWSVTTFTTVGYGDFSPNNTSEKIIGSFFMLVNVAIAAWIIGSITMLIIKGDETTREYRESLEILNLYGRMHNFDCVLLNKLKEQLRLGFNNREISDEQVLKHFPSAVRRKLIRRLYRRYLVHTKLMEGVPLQFIDAFLTSCTVEIFSPGEEIVERGSILSDLFLIVGGMANVVQYKPSLMEVSEHSVENSDRHSQKLEAGDFIGEVGFFTESPQVDFVVSLTAVKTLTMSRSAYKLLAQDHPGSVRKILQNLLVKVESSHAQKTVQLPRPGSVSTFHAFGGYQSLGPARLDSDAGVGRHEDSLTSVKDLVTIHIHRTHDHETTRFLYAASRGDKYTVSLMCGYGFDPDNTDYHQRTALMVASMKGNADIVMLLLQYDASPNKTDAHGSCALLEATKNGHEHIMDLLLQYSGNLCMSETQAASHMCQAVFDGDILLLKRLLKAGVNIDATHYDKRTAAHIAMGEGNIAALRLLVEKGANLTIPDRWGRTVEDEAARSNVQQLAAFLQ